MIGSYLNCYTLGRSVPSKERLDFVLPCRRQQALLLFALLIDDKRMLVPQQKLISLRIPDTRLSASRIANNDIATFLWRSGYLGHASNPLVRLLERWVYEYQLFRHLRRTEKTVDEVIIECFHSSQGELPTMALANPENPPQDLLLSRLHFTELSEEQTLLRIFTGWTDAAPLAELNELYGLHRQYIHLLTKVLMPTTNESKPAESPHPLTESEPVAAHSNGVSAEKFNSIPAENESSEKQKPEDWLIEKADEHDLLHIPNSFLQHNSVKEGSPSEAGAEAIGGEAEGADKRPQVDSKPADDEALYRYMTPPRLYGKTLAKVCLMVAERQRQFDKRGWVQDINQVGKQIGPSRNTLRKVPELVTHWDDARYRWNVKHWLRCYSGHNQQEISELMSYLKHHLTETVWAVVTQAGEEEANKNRRHPTQDERDSREKG